MGQALSRLDTDETSGVCRRIGSALSALQWNPRLCGLPIFSCGGARPAAQRRAWISAPSPVPGNGAMVDAWAFRLRSGLVWDAALRETVAKPAGARLHVASALRCLERHDDSSPGPSRTGVRCVGLRETVAVSRLDPGAWRRRCRRYQLTAAIASLTLCQVV